MMNEYSFSYYTIITFKSRSKTKVIIFPHIMLTIPFIKPALMRLPVMVLS